MGEWNHFVLVINNGQGQLYKNDSLIADGKLDLSTTSKSLVLGGNSYYPFSASYDDLKIYNYAVSPNEVHNLFKDNVITGFDVSSENKLGVYPNPASTEININEYVEVVDMLGNKVASGKGRIDVSNLQVGVYFVKSENATTKFVKE